MSDLHVVGGVSTDWIIGWKAAFVAITPDLRTLQFRSVAISGGSSYGTDAKAECLFYEHASPNDLCRCGFNSWHEYETALRYMRFYQALQLGHSYKFHPYIDFRWSVALLRVGVYGDVVEGTLKAGYDWHHWGYRASHQRVSDVFFDGMCIVPGCGKMGQYVCAGKMTYIYKEVLLPLRLHCPEHAASAKYIFQHSGLSQRNDVGLYRKLPSE